MAQAMQMMQKRMEDEAKLFQTMQKGAHPPMRGASPQLGRFAFLLDKKVACCDVEGLRGMRGVYVAKEGASVPVEYFGRVLTGSCVCMCRSVPSPNVKNPLHGTEHSSMGQAFSKLMAQHNENEMVLKELKFLDDDSKVYKLVGPVLLNQVCGTFGCGSTSRVQHNISSVPPNSCLEQWHAPRVA